MAECRICGKNLKFAEGVNATIYNGICKSCRNQLQESAEDTEAHLRQTQKEVAEEAKLRDQINSVLLTTETAPNLNITERIEIVTAECAFGMKIFKDLFAGVRNVVGGRSEAVQKTMRDSRRTALYELKKEAYEVGANAVVGVDLDYVELAGTGSSMVMLVASGTAVVIEGENG